jgi:hypothetical protein
MLNVLTLLIKLLAFCGKNTDLPFSSLKNERKWVGNSKPVIPGQKPNESLKADHPPSGFFGLILGLCRRVSA